MAVLLTIFTFIHLESNIYIYFCSMQNNNSFNFDTVQDYCDFCGVSPAHPLVVTVDSRNLSLPQLREHTARYGLYAVFLKQTKGCTINYGRTTYDYDDQSVVCIGPGQIIHTVYADSDITPQFRGLLFHPDLLFRTSLANKIRSYSFFGYSSREALHLSADERANVEDCFDRIDRELRHPVDRFSKGLIASHIELLLDYCLRYYSRQFELREVTNAGVMARFDSLLDAYLNSDSAVADGVPNVKYFADRLALSANYFGDLVKREAGVTALDYIQEKLLRRAQQLLLSNENNVSQTAYALGFQYPQHFIRFFKRRTGQTPKEFINAN